MPGVQLRTRKSLPATGWGFILVQVDHRTKKYGDVAAITVVTFSAEKGEILGFLGPNAAGKTTTMRIVTGFMPPTSGTASIAGFDVVDDALEARQRLGYLPENVPLYEDMTVRGYLGFYAKLRGVSSAKIPDRVAYVMEATRITGEVNTIIGKLSKGFRQRVGIAQALVHNPDVLILDEPTVGLDPRQIIEIRELIRGLRGPRNKMVDLEDCSDEEIEQLEEEFKRFRARHKQRQHEGEHERQHEAKHADQAPRHEKLHTQG